MRLKDLLALATKENDRKEHLKVLQMFAASLGVVTGVGIVVGIAYVMKSAKGKRDSLNKCTASPTEIIKELVLEKLAATKQFSAHTQQEVSDATKAILDKAGSVKKDITNGSEEISHDIHKTIENVSDELKKH